MARQFAARDDISSIVGDLSDQFRSHDTLGKGSGKKRAEARAASVSLYPYLHATFDTLEPKAQLSQIGRALKAIDHRVDLLAPNEVQAWQEFLFYVEDQAIATDERGARVRVVEWAQRLSEELAA